MPRGPWSLRARAQRLKRVVAGVRSTAAIGRRADMALWQQNLMQHH